MKASKREIPIQVERLASSDKGGYILEFRIEQPLWLSVGKLGDYNLEPGWYYYIGSGMGGLRGRISRHIIGPNKTHWHIDYLTRFLTPSRIWFVVTKSPVESDLVLIVSTRADPAIDKFGCGDSPGSESHLFYSRSKRNFNVDLKRFGYSEQVDVE